MGIAPINTKISDVYRHGGGSHHNVDAETINSIETIKIKFDDAASFSTLTLVQSSIYVNNPAAASGGSNAPTLNEIKQAMARPSTQGCA